MTISVKTDKGEITTVESWFDFAPPKGKKRQWVDGRSAKELAKAWCSTGIPQVPDMLRKMIESHPDFGAITWESGEPEAKVRFDHIKGEPRNSDLVIDAHDKSGRIAISIEAKADESFGPMVGDALADAIDRATINPRSKALMRIQQLVASLLPPSHAALPDLKSIRYQLLTATAGALAWARDCKSNRAVLVIHEFRSVKTSDSTQVANHRDLDRFIRRVAGANIQRNLVPERLIGPLSVSGDPLFTDPAALYFGLIATDCV